MHHSGQAVRVVGTWCQGGGYEVSGCTRVGGVSGLIGCGLLLAMLPMPIHCTGCQVNDWMVLGSDYGNAVLETTVVCQLTSHQVC